VRSNKLRAWSIAQAYLEYNSQCLLGSLHESLRSGIDWCNGVEVKDSAVRETTLS